MRPLSVDAGTGPPPTDPSPSSATREALNKVGSGMVRSPYLSAGAAVLALVIIMSFSSQFFLTEANGVALIYTVSIVALLAIGETIVLISGGVDLSAGSVLGLSGMLSAYLIQTEHISAFLAILVCLGVGLVTGAVNGLAIAYIRVSPFIVTLATGSVATGLTLVISQGSTVQVTSAAFNWLGGTAVHTIPVLFFIILVLFALFEFGLRRTVVGRELYALGGNSNSAVLAGISRHKIQIGTYSLAGLLYGLAGLAQVGILSAATSSAGADDLLTPIAAAVIGGVSLFGGEGSVLAAGLGIIVIGVISDGLVLLNISTFYTQIVYGVVVFVAVLLDSGRRMLVRRRA
jgi:ribose/xylose/arabinose/galactoside ABC-type transport system permease subunit